MGDLRGPELPPSVTWRRTGLRRFIAAALVEGPEGGEVWWVLRMNAFPEHPLWTFFVDGRRHGDLEDTPRGWTIPRMDETPMNPAETAVAVGPVEAWTAYGGEVGRACDDPWCCGE